MFNHGGPDISDLSSHERLSSDQGNWVNVNNYIFLDVRPGQAAVHNCLFQDKNYSEMSTTRGDHHHHQGLPHSPANIPHCKKWNPSREIIPCNYNYYKQTTSTRRYLLLLKEYNLRKIQYFISWDHFNFLSP